MLWGRLIKNITDKHTYIVKSVVLYLEAKHNKFTVHNTTKSCPSLKLTMKILRYAAAKSSRLKLTHCINVSCKSKVFHFQVKIKKRVTHIREKC